VELRLKEDWLGYFLSGVLAGMAISILTIIYASSTSVYIGTVTVLELIAAAVLSITMFVIACVRKTKPAGAEC
jgi:formate/nitrite transporter FocA (FNT family)